MAAQRRRSSAGRRPASRARSGGSARGGAARGGPARGGRRAPARGGGGIGAGPIIGSICILLAGILGIIFVLKEDDKPTKPEQNTNVVRQPDKPVRQVNAPSDPYEGRGPPPELDKEMQDRARSVMSRMQNMLKKVKRLQKESVEAKQAGDDDLWQETLTEATGVHDEMKDLWNEVISELPSNDKWDQEMVANWHLALAVKPLAEAGKVLAGSDKIRRK